MISVIQLTDKTDDSLPDHWPRWRRVIGAAAAVLLVGGAFLLFGPIGLGNGPLNVRWDGTVGWTDTAGVPTALMLPLFNAGGSAAVVDSVDLVGETRYATPRLLHIEAVSETECAGAWPARPVGRGFALVSCPDTRDRGSLLGRSIRPHTAPDSRGFQAAAIATAPRPGTCWVITKIVIHYHVGIRHYAATDVFTIAVCGSGAARQESAAMDAATATG